MDTHAPGALTHSPSGVHTAGHAHIPQVLTWPGDVSDSSRVEKKIRPPKGLELGSSSEGL